MKYPAPQSLLALILAGSLTISQAAGPALGVAIAKGAFRVDGSPVTDNATLFGGTAIETGDASSRIQLSNGARIELAPRSRAKVFEDHLTLENGRGELSAKEYQIEAKTLRIAGDTGSVARVRIDGPKSVMVSAINGPVHVYNEIGLLVANVKPGLPLAFEPQAAAPTASERSGCLLVSREDRTKFILVDTVANVTVELRGENLAEQVGNQVTIAGSAFRSAVPVTGASQVIQVQSLKVVSQGGCSTAPTTPTRPAPVAKTGGGLSNGAKIAIAVVAAGGAAGGVVAASGGSKSR